MCTTPLINKILLKQISLILDNNEAVALNLDTELWNRILYQKSIPDNILSDTTFYPSVKTNIYDRHGFKQKKCEIQSK